MKIFLTAWWRGIGVLGLYLALSIVAGGLSLLAEALPKSLQFAIGLPLLIVLVPPALFWTFRWLYPEIASAKTRFSTGATRK